MRALWRIVTEIWRAVRFELLSTFGSLLTIFLATILPGIIWVASKNLAKVESDLRNNITMDVFLRDGIRPTDIDSLKTRLLALEGIKDVAFISKEDALAKMRTRFGSELLLGLDENPLPASFELKIDKSLFEPGAAEALTKKIAAWPQVEDVVLAWDILNRLGKIINSVKILGLSLSLLVAFAAVFIVANTVRVAISDRRKTVEIMQLVGATRGYILSPFVLLGGFLGMAGATLSAAVLAWFSSYISKNMMSISFLEPHEIIVFILTGLLLGMIGAIIATQKYLEI